jgi:hypothetical protein
MTLQDLEDHIDERYHELCERFTQDADFMTEFRRCLECEANGIYFYFVDISSIMFHVSEIHPEVKRDVSRSLRYYLCQARYDAD